ncbi:DNA-directed RNA polymerase, subunit E'/Rpb9 [Yasminevirus sp. GU-2018]|uniref:DNA-directed RNA polymerase, subunit E'/Rpb9 n=1 Tax=Yasminevirus sp. GU-2018 TaxID=2420051 RepID=A0A5K0U8S5_9VIRU|nr:DNA-directed RNA polymerase, subunit E'/Rpb9 [Yasminevirus sp. GU-2018]
MSKGPYFITTLEADVPVHPSQMDNNIMDNIRKNLERTYLNKCYDNYGFISKIFDVDNDIKGGIIRAEDTTSSSVHRVKFNCRICNPMKKSIIMGMITSITNMMIVAENGPIRFVIGASEVNGDNIQYKKSAFYPVSSKGEIINKPINKGTYVMIQVMSKKLVKGKKNIVVFGRLESVVLDADVKSAIREKFDSNEHITADQLTKEHFDIGTEADLVQEDESDDGGDDDD